MFMQDDRIPNAFIPPSLPPRHSFDTLPAISVIDVKVHSNAETVDWLEQPVNMVTDPMKQIMEKYNRGLRFKRVYYIDREHSFQQQYWFMDVPKLDGISGQSEFYPDQRLRRLILDREKVKGHHIFALESALEPYIFASLETVESLLRRGLTGFRLSRVECS